jgi:hypothetical protein
MLPIELHKCALGQILQPLYLRIGWELLSKRVASAAYSTPDPRLLQKHYLDPLIRGRDSTRCACVGRAWRSLPA